MHFSRLKLDNMGDYIRQLQRFNVGEDCPVFDGLFEFCQISASGSIGKFEYNCGQPFVRRPYLASLKQRHLQCVTLEASLHLFLKL
jgi:hypothetical protein